jgi:hypothetical protein
MKKIFFLIAVFCGFFAFSQTSTLVISNYSSYYLEGRLGATGNCNPFVYAVPTAGLSAYTVPPATMVSYDKYYYSNTAAVPITQWLVNASGNNPIIRNYNHPVLLPLGAVATSSDWSLFWFETFDAAHNLYEYFNMGVNPSCNGSVTTYKLGIYSEAEWFTITSGSIVYTYINIY